MTRDIKWQSPPPSKTRGRAGMEANAEFADALRRRPGEWAIFREDAVPNVAGAIRCGRSKAFRPAGAFEATVRMIPGTTRAVIYVRYVGGEA